MARMLLSAPVPDRAIPCALLFAAMGSRYGAAERTLALAGWFYVIGDDAWVYGWGSRRIPWMKYDG